MALFDHGSKHAYLWALLIAGAAALSMSPYKAQAEDEVVIGVVQALSGPGSVLSPPVLQSAELAVDELNAAGGILGHKVRIENGDDGTDPRIAEQAWDSLINQRGAKFIISMETSAGREAGIPVAEKANVPAIYTSLYEGASCNPILYANAEVPNQQTDPLVKYLTEKEGAKTWFLVGSDYLWPHKSFEIAKKVIEAAGGEVVGEEYSPIGTTDWAAIVSKINRTQPSVVLLAIAGGADNVSIMKQKNASGSSAIVASLDIEEGALSALGQDGEGIYVPASYFSTLDTPENKKYTDALKAKFGDKMATPTFFGAPTYDAIHQFALAAEKAGTLDGSAVLKALSEISFTGPRGPVTMTPDRHASLPVYLGKARADGKFDIVQSLGVVEATKQCDPAPKLGSK
jgi:branched-chain amino acid transport system substrate-binding protein